MDRRQFVGGLSAALAFSGVPGITKALGDNGWRSAFHDALKRKPWLLGFLGTKSEVLQGGRLTVSGRLPAGLRGTFFRNGPAQHEIGNLRYQHWFDGDGMVQSFRFDGQGHVDHLGKIVLTEKYQSEKERGEAYLPAFGTIALDSTNVLSADQLNVANINIVRHADRLMALWEGGSAYELDFDSLDTKGPVTWSEDTAGLPFGAHPRFDRQGNMWNIGYGVSQAALIIYRIDKSGRLAQKHIHKLEKPGMIHDFIITDRHVVVAVPPLYYRPTAGASILDSYTWHGDSPTQFLIFSRDDLSRVRVVDAPAMWVFHYGNAWEDSAGRIHFDLARYPDSSIIFGALRDVMAGADGKYITSDLDQGSADYTSAVLDADAGTFSETMVKDPRLQATEFLRFDPRYSGVKHSDTVFLAVRPNDPVWDYRFSQVCRMNRETGDLEVFNYGDDVFVEEHVLVPKPDRGDDFWVVGTTLHYPSGQTRLNVFEGKKLSHGPVAVAEVSFALPLGFHGNFISD